LKTAIGYNKNERIGSVNKLKLFIYTFSNNEGMFNVFYYEFSKFF